ncbi:hypothetical protein B0H11DRAFT_2412301 [Mycena galericulata]|nr:hypothetical protein B0H11DRAFT_2412301 [Mycena galericulata]
MSKIEKSTAARPVWIVVGRKKKEEKERRKAGAPRSGPGNGALRSGIGPTARQTTDHAPLPRLFDSVNHTRRTTQEGLPVAPSAFRAAYPPPFARRPPSSAFLLPPQPPPTGPRSIDARCTMQHTTTAAARGDAGRAKREAGFMEDPGRSAAFDHMYTPWILNPPPSPTPTCIPRVRMCGEGKRKQGKTQEADDAGVASGGRAQSSAGRVRNAEHRQTDACNRTSCAFSLTSAGDRHSAPRTEGEEDTSGYCYSLRCAQPAVMGAPSVGRLHPRPTLKPRADFASESESDSDWAGGAPRYEMESSEGRGSRRRRRKMKERKAKPKESGKRKKEETREGDVRSSVGVGALGARKGRGQGREKGRTGVSKRGGDADVRSGGGEELDKGAGGGSGLRAKSLMIETGKVMDEGKEVARTEGSTGEEDYEDGAPEVFPEIPDAPGKEDRRRDEHLWMKKHDCEELASSQLSQNVGRITRGQVVEKTACMRIYAQDIHLAFHTVSRDLSTRKESGKGSVIRVQEVRNEGDGIVVTGINAHLAMPGVQSRVLTAWKDKKTYASTWAGTENASGRRTKAEKRCQSDGRGVWKENTPSGARVLPRNRREDGLETRLWWWKTRSELVPGYFCNDIWNSRCAG